MPNIAPTVGRMVYYKTRGSADGVFPPTDFAAIITAVSNEEGPYIWKVCLATFGVSGLRFEQNVSQGQEPGQWDWMPFQKDQVARMAQGTLNGSHPLVGNGASNTTSYQPSSVL